MNDYIQLHADYHGITRTIIYFAVRLRLYALFESLAIQSRLQAHYPGTSEHHPDQFRIDNQQCLLVLFRQEIVSLGKNKLRYVTHCIAWVLIITPLIITPYIVQLHVPFTRVLLHRHPPTPRPSESIYIISRAVLCTDHLSYTQQSIEARPVDPGP